MGEILVLDQITIDKIAAGEVVERPSSIVKELVENAVDAKATAVTVEIKSGGISFIRITDNGGGIEKDQIRTAFLRHATSKIRSADDLIGVASLGFRGEALSSIAAVSQVEVITKAATDLLGVRYVIEGGKEKSLEEIGAPQGTTFIVRNVFYNTPARQKFLKSPQTEAGYVNDLLERLALSHPDVSFKFINNGQVKMHTSGNTNLKDIIYGVFGREIANHLLAVDEERDGVRIQGFIGKPVIARGNRNYENYYINGRYVKSRLIARAIEDGYKTFMMQHKFPFTALHITVPAGTLDVNVHPTKMEVRIADQEALYSMITEVIRSGLGLRELIPQVKIGPEGEAKREKSGVPFSKDIPEPFEIQRLRRQQEQKQAGTSGNIPGQSGQGMWQSNQKAVDHQHKADAANYQQVYHRDSQETQPGKRLLEGAAVYGEKSLTEPSQPMQNAGLDPAAEQTGKGVPAVQVPANGSAETGSVNAPAGTDMVTGNHAPAGIDAAAGNNESARNDISAENAAAAGANAATGNDVALGKHAAMRNEEEAIAKGDIAAPKDIEQMTLFEEKLLSPQAKDAHKIIGQLFETYWMVEYQEKLYIIDQHAAHEKVLYERTMKGLADREYTSQQISPPIILSLSMQEEEVLGKYKDYFTELGFEISHFGGKEYSVSAVPDNLFGVAQKDLLMEILDGLTDQGVKQDAAIITEKIASASCKAAVKGNHRLSLMEAQALIDELLTLENPYNCPHGRPTIIAMTKYELEKKFKRIV